MAAGVNPSGTEIKLENVAKSYQGRTVLQPLTLVIPGGQTTVLLGPSGSGKSTLLRLIIALVEPDSGQVFIGGEPLTQANAFFLRRRMGYVIQEGGLFPHLSAYDNAALMARFLGWREARVAARISELAALTQLPEAAMWRFPLHLSGGQRQRVSLMRALMLDPDVLLLDEPLGALDPLIRADLQEDLRQIFSVLRKTVVLVTHDIGEAVNLADAVVMLRDGRIVQIGALEELARHPKDPFVSHFMRAQRLPTYLSAPC